MAPVSHPTAASFIPAPWVTTISSTPARMKVAGRTMALLNVRAAFWRCSGSAMNSIWLVEECHEQHLVGRTVEAELEHLVT
jgi:hypothetical protein